MTMRTRWWKDQIILGAVIAVAALCWWAVGAQVWAVVSGWWPW